MKYFKVVSDDSERGQLKDEPTTKQKYTEKEKTGARSKETPH